MTRREKTEFLSKLLIDEKLNQRSVYWASEVTLHYTSKDTKRVDFMRFQPRNQSVSGIEQGIFTCYEVKSCKEDYQSGHGVNFVGDKNYIVTDMETYKKIKNKIPRKIGVIAPIPHGLSKFDEMDNPTPLNTDVRWELKTIKNAMLQDRSYPMCELLFYMLRSGK